MTNPWQVHGSLVCYRLFVKFQALTRGCCRTDRTSRNNGSRRANWSFQKIKPARIFSATTIPRDLSLSLKPTTSGSHKLHLQLSSPEFITSHLLKLISHLHFAFFQPKNSTQTYAKTRLLSVAPGRVTDTTKAKLTIWCKVCRGKFACKS